MIIFHSYVKSPEDKFEIMAYPIGMLVHGIPHLVVGRVVVLVPI